MLGRQLDSNRKEKISGGPSAGRENILLFGHRTFNFATHYLGCLLAVKAVHAGAPRQREHFRTRGIRDPGLASVGFLLKPADGPGGVINSYQRIDIALAWLLGEGAPDKLVRDGGGNRAIFFPKLIKHDVLLAVAVALDAEGVAELVQANGAHFVL